MIKLDIIDAFLCSVSVSERNTLCSYLTSSTLPPIPSRCPTSPTARQPSSFPLSSLPGESSPRSPPGVPPLPQQGNPRHSHPAVLPVSLPSIPSRSPTSPTARQPSSFPPSSPPGESSPVPLQVSHLSHSKATLVIPTQQSSR